ncbi:hypothetical protein GCM10017786_71090 [Amycolatopsis deserti]|uniref:Uncharacterized protein n=1 Tax=Amycolatopsis deserti TaxID=185696 RepID=A0ABQ3JKV5_9PSEU|nr:hypothetical protein [Amycolatopsis deserti]GHF26687.1 hypothetical protein GCM10017786_71090 [Amycolatopsis deserti]
MAEHAVLVRIPSAAGLSVDWDSIEAPLFKAINAAGVGELDGHEVNLQDGSVTFYMYGPDADRLHEIVRPVLRDAELPAGTTVVRRYGGPGAEQVATEL